MKKRQRISLDSKECNEKQKPIPQNSSSLDPHQESAKSNENVDVVQNGDNPPEEIQPQKKQRIGNERKHPIALNTKSNDTNTNKSVDLNSNHTIAPSQLNSEQVSAIENDNLHVQNGSLENKKKKKKESVKDNVIDELVDSQIKSKKAKNNTKKISIPSKKQQTPIEPNTNTQPESNPIAEKKKNNDNDSILEKQKISNSTQDDSSLKLPTKTPPSKKVMEGNSQSKPSKQDRAKKIQQDQKKVSNSKSVVTEPKKSKSNNHKIAIPEILNNNGNSSNSSNNNTTTLSPLPPGSSIPTVMEPIFQQQPKPVPKPHPISFVPSQTLITDNEAKEHIIKNYLMKYWKSHVTLNYFPGPLPEPITRENLGKITKNNYMFTAKSDGVRYFLLLYKNTKNEEKAVMIDRKMDFYEIRVWCGHSYFDGTLLDGEMVWENKPNHKISGEKKALYQAFDIVLLKGAVVGHENLSRRIEYLKPLFSEPTFTDTQKDPQIAWEENASIAKNGKIASCNNLYDLQFSYKPYHQLSNLRTLANKIEYSSSAFPTDGIVFMPINDKVGKKKSPNIIKFKQTHTIDFKCSLIYDPSGVHKVALLYGDDCGFDYNNKEKKKLKLKDACEGIQISSENQKNDSICFTVIQNNELQTVLRELEKSKNSLEFIGEFVIYKSNDKIEPLTFNCELQKIRPDKVEPNSWSTLTRTIRAINQNISLKELLDILDPIPPSNLSLPLPQPSQPVNSAPLSKNQQDQQHQQQETLDPIRLLNMLFQNASNQTTPGNTRNIYVFPIVFQKQ